MTTNHEQDDDEQPPTAAAADSDDTELGPAADETEVVPPVTEAAPELAWSHEEAPTEAMPRPWRSAWVLAGIGMACAVVIALVVVGIGMMVHRDHAPTRPQAAPLPTRASPAKPPVDDDEYVAMAISLRSLNNHSLTKGGFGTGDGGTQERANQIALSECRSKPGYDDCMLVNSGMYHGCISLAIDNSENPRWATGSGADANVSQADAARRLGSPASVIYGQCSDPPGILKPAPASPSPQAVAPLPPPPPTTVTVQAAPPPAVPPRDADQVFREGVSGIPGIRIINWDVAEAGARSICGGFAHGMSRDQVIDSVQRNDPTFTPWQTSGMVNVALAAYCPQYEGN